ncbi:nickel-binding protein [Maribellus mangrovi]|uniref:nickel-binding protein n=1 Tax=Maribellus mangrovi TaxID=3133146 RepID=UPI0030EB409E
MPLFMDYHIAPGVTIEEAKQSHMRDLAVQSKYNVKYHQYWVNEEAGMVFCLMEGPDKESIMATHREANDLHTCNIIEVTGGMYSAFMAYGQELDDDIVMKNPEQPDTGYRFILTLDIISLTSLKESINFDKLKFPEKPRQKASDILRRYQGRILQQLQNDCLIATFYTPESAVQCAVAIKNEFNKKIEEDEESGWNIKFKMGISVGQPVTEKENTIFEKALEQSYRLCKIADDGEIMSSILVGKLSVFCDQEIENKTLKVINEAEQNFLDRLFNIVDTNYPDEAFNVEILSKEIGVSRPHLYRKIRHLTGTSPIAFIRDLRMSKALSLIKQRKKNITEIALDVGMNNPSYFAKCFHDKYGILPSQVAV